jgi:hypothetical protein
MDVFHGELQKKMIGCFSFYEEKAIDVEEGRYYSRFSGSYYTKLIQYYVLNYCHYRIRVVMDLVIFTLLYKTISILVLIG